MNGTDRKPRSGIKVYKKHLPDDIYQLLHSVRSEQEKQCKCCYSYERTIYMLLRKLINP